MPVPDPTQLSRIEFEGMLGEIAVHGVGIWKHEHPDPVAVLPAQQSHRKYQTCHVARQF